MLKISAVWRNRERKETRRQTRPNLSRVPPSTLKPLVRTRHLHSSDTHQADSAELEWNVSNIESDLLLWMERNREEHAPYTRKTISDIDITVSLMCRIYTDESGPWRKPINMYRTTSYIWNSIWKCSDAKGYFATPAKHYCFHPLTCTSLTCQSNTTHHFLRVVSPKPELHSWNAIGDQVINPD